MFDEFAITEGFDSETGDYLIQYMGDSFISLRKNTKEIRIRTIGLQGEELLGLMKYIRIYFIDILKFKNTAFFGLVREDFHLFNVKVKPEVKSAVLFTTGEESRVLNARFWQKLTHTHVFTFVKGDS
jgi:hypothetical protein